ncbi:cilia- and flagella-associated protein 299-like, partial [Vespula squamosa]
TNLLPKRSKNLIFVYQNDYSRCTGETLDKDSFYRRLQVVKDLLYPIPKAYHLTSEFLIPFDPVMQELAIRERSNRLHVLSTIIFVRHNPRLQVEVSGYIDFNERLKAEDWQPYFEGKRKLWPKITDLAYYHWKVGKMQVNVSSNYEPVIDSKHGLLLKNIHDRKYINVDPKAVTPGVDTTRIRIYSDAYKHVILYDHENGISEKKKFIGRFEKEANKKQTRRFMNETYSTPFL